MLEIKLPEKWNVVSKTDNDFCVSDGAVFLDVARYDDRFVCRWLEPDRTTLPVELLETSKLHECNRWLEAALDRL